MMTFHRFILAVSLLLAVEVHSAFNRADPVVTPNTCPVKFPNGFFCNFACETWGLLSGNTVVCFISNNGQYGRFIGRNPTVGIWRFYKVDEYSDVSTLCQTAVNGDEFYLNKTDLTCNAISAANQPSGRSLLTRLMRHAPKNEGRRLPISNLMGKINEAVSTILGGGKISGKYQGTSGKLTDDSGDQPAEAAADAPAEEAAGDSKRSSRRELRRQMPPMNAICQIVMADLCRKQKMIDCNQQGRCCWSESAAESCSQEKLTDYENCYESLHSVINTLNA